MTHQAVSQLVTLGVMISLLLPFTSTQTCTKKPGKMCSCSLENGTEISLDAISDDNTPVFMDVKEANHSDADGRNYRYDYAPCRSFIVKEAGPSCHGVTVCQKDMNASSPAYNNLGELANTHFGWDVNQNRFYISYRGFDGENWRTTNVSLHCDWSMSETTHSLDVFRQNPAHRFEYRMTLNSLCACPGGCPPERPPAGLTSGGVFLIIIFGGAAAYLVIGLLYRRMIVGATGWEMVPNRGFWVSLPGLVRDGVTYCITCRRVHDADGYDQI